MTMFVLSTAGRPFSYCSHELRKVKNHTTILSLHFAENNDDIITRKSAAMAPDDAALVSEIIKLVLGTTQHPNHELLTH